MHRCLTLAGEEYLLAVSIFDCFGRSYLSLESVPHVAIAFAAVLSVYSLSILVKKLVLLLVIGLQLIQLLHCVQFAARRHLIQFLLELGFGIATDVEAIFSSISWVMPLQLILPHLVLLEFLHFLFEFELLIKVF